MMLAAAWILSLVTGGAKAGVPLIIFQIMIVLAFALWIGRAQISLEPWTTPFLCLLAWLPVNLLAPAALPDKVQGIIKIAGYGVFFLMLKNSWGERSRKLFINSVTLAGCIDAALVLLEVRAGKPRTGLFPGNPNYSAGLLAVTISLGLTSLLSEWKGRRTVSAQMLGQSAIVGFCLGSLGLHDSRGAWLGLFAALLYLLQRLWGWKTAFKATGTIGALALVLSSHYVFQLSKLTGGQDNFARLLLWKSALKIIGERPLAGWGIDHFENGFRLHPVISNEGLFRYEQMTAFAHSEYLQIAADMGIPALVFFIWALARLWRAAQDKMGTQASLVALLTQSAFDMILHLPALAILGAGLAGAMNTEESGASRILRPGKNARRMGWGVSALVLAFLGFQLAPARRLPFGEAHWRQQAEDLHEHGNLKDPQTIAGVEKNYKRALAVNPHDPWLWEKWGHWLGVHSSPDRWGEALLAYERAKSLSPYHAPFYCLAGELSLAHGDALRAREEFRRCLSLEPHALRAWKGLEISYEMLHERPEAARLQTFLTALSRRIDPQRPKGALSNYASYLLDTELSIMAHQP